VITPEKTEAAAKYSAKFELSLSEKLRVLDDSLSESAFAASAPANPFNLTIAESRKAGSAIGCDFFILISPVIARRSASGRAEYYEASAATFVISSRSGRLVFWRMPRFEAEKSQTAEKSLFDSTGSLASEIVSRLKSVSREELAETPARDIEEIPDENSAADKNFRAPVPYRRIKPEYTADAFLFDIKATVDIVVDLDENGSILRTEIVRWAGYGLDESVTDAVRKMNWRPAERGGKRLPMRFLLRYNFKKFEK